MKGSLGMTKRNHLTLNDLQFVNLYKSPFYNAWIASVERGILELLREGYNVSILTCGRESTANPALSATSAGLLQHLVHSDLSTDLEKG